MLGYAFLVFTLGIRCLPLFPAKARAEVEEPAAPEAAAPAVAGD